MSERNGRIEFESGFRRTNRGDLLQELSGKTLRVFRRPLGYAWSIVEGKNTRYSGTHRWEDDALISLAQELGVEP